MKDHDRNRTTKLFSKCQATCPTQGEGEGILRTRREFHVQDEQQKMRKIRKAPRMKNLSILFFIRKVFAILTSYILIYFMLKNAFLFLRDLIP
jgi:hypothetical protein